MKVCFLSDAHLVRESDDNYQRMAAFLAELPQDLDRLVINGDFFDCWYRDNRTAGRMYAPILQRLGALSRRGVKVTFVEGNHDIAIQKTLTALGVEYVTGDLRLNVDGKRVLCVHGDMVTGDSLYRLWHAALRSPVAAGLDTVLPAELTLRIGLGMSNASRARSRDEEESIRNKIRAFAKSLRDVDVFITGHTHIPMDERVEAATGSVHVVNLGDWIRNFTYLWVENQQWELRRAESLLR